MTRTTVSACKVVFLAYDNEIITGKEADLSVTDYEIDRQVLAFEYSKQMGSPSGQFTLELTADVNWKKYVFVDNWVLVYLSNENQYYLRMIGNIDRVSQFTTRNDQGLLETRYIISGRDVGKVFEDCNIWFNPTDTTRFALGTLARYDSPDKLIKSIIDIFLGGKVPVDYLKNQPQLNQWKIPNLLIEKIQGEAQASAGGGPRATDLFVMNLQSLSGYQVIMNFALLQGSLWNVLQQYSNDVLNEMFIELDGNSRPNFYLRMKPFAKKGFNGGSINSEINYFTDLPQAVINVKDIIGSDTGYSTSDRFNTFLMTSSNDVLGVEELIQLLKPWFPNEAMNQASIQRNGLKLMYLDTDFALIQSGDKNKINPRLLLDWNKAIYEWFNNEVFMESGSIEIIKANPDIRIGSTLVIEADATGDESERQFLHQDKIFYIEGYTDSWSFPGEWHQTVMLSRGQYLVKGKEALTYTTDTAEKIYTGQTIVKKDLNNAG